MISLKSLANTFHRLDSGHAPTAVYQKWFSHWDDNICWWCGGTVSQTWEHLFRHGSWWRNHQKELWKAMGKATSWRVGRCRHVLISELLSIEECDQAVMDFLAATEVGNFHPGEVAVGSGLRAQGSGEAGVVMGLDKFLSFFLSVILLSYLSFVNGDEGWLGGSSAIQPARPEAEGVINVLSYST